MNFFKGGYRYSPAVYRTCCEDLKPIVLNKNVRREQILRRLKPVQQSFLNPRNILKSTIWTPMRHLTSCQILYQKDCPRLHQDIDFPNFDSYRKDDYVDVRKTSWGSGDSKPGITYFMGFFGYMCGAYAVKTELTHFLSSMSAAADVLALASIEVDLSKVAPGACVSYKWRGKPLFIKNRTQADIDREANTPLSALRDPQTPEQRAQKPEWLVVIGICTHLGCVPIPNTGDFPGGFYCPCHGSHYDNVGRARKGPAPLNLEVPPYKYLSDTLVLVG